MSFSEAQKLKFIKLLETKGWEWRDNTVWSKGGGLWFSDAHFTDWSPAQMHEIFKRRSTRIAKAKVGDWQRASCENEEASWAAEEVSKL